MRRQNWRRGVCGLALVACSGCDLKPQDLLQDALGMFANTLAMKWAENLVPMAPDPMTTNDMEAATAE